MLFIYITRLASNEIFSPSNKIDREVGRAKDLLVLISSKITVFMKFQIYLQTFLIAETHPAHSELLK